MHMPLRMRALLPAILKVSRAKRNRHQPCAGQRNDLRCKEMTIGSQGLKARKAPIYSAARLVAMPLALPNSERRGAKQA
jgi:hypothetical protein